ncbi:phenylalanyl-tRNA synthetase subunit beta [Actibacterium atlanticum]|uniref:Phenylalanyl-tRNA synthetase subunit beta n=1 Tax=Actibacterium atlanticum TaxID=1461693 RepID=A0A058ZJ30_9RHOB|nr:DM13 domain-containing protein [Actibacterium atlanticum]KCV80786.1 phenylalanyl-tRNA synthetase subunit beta [Actibacterium atlanticum]
MRRLFFLFISHGVALAAGFALGIYLLPILTAPPSPDAQVLEESASEAMFTATLTRELRGSDFVHWGEGTISVSADKIVHIGKLAPGPDYKLYLVKEFAQHEDEFEPIKDQAVQVGDVKTFEGFVLDVPAEVDVTQYSTVLVWCEAFGEFITAGQYQ